MHKRLWIAITVLVWLVALATWERRCAPAWLAYGISVRACPDGDLRQTAELDAAGLGREVAGEVALRAIAHYTTRDADRDQRAVVRHVGAIALSLTGGGQDRPLEVAAWRRGDGALRAQIVLPAVPDGDYQLHATYRTALGAGEVSVPLKIYAPARIHVLTDRPLYQPGNTVRFRAVVLRARDLVPLDRRPGIWVVTDPGGEVLLEEAAPAGDWGVVAGSFPLDRAARSGTWKVAWRSADATDEVPFTVQPFTLPRFRVDATADRPFYRPGDRPILHGAVVYSSGAPVASATVEVAWEATGAWPPPAEWQDHLLPRHAQTSASGRFDLALPEIPADLQGWVTLTARIAAVDPAGDRAAGAASVLLSQDGIEASAVTELGDGLVESFNNRMYLRVTTPDGRVLSGTRLTVRRAWVPGDRGVAAQTDEDGVASLQIDPGAPVNIVIPALPYRPPPRPPAVTRGEVSELIGGHDAALADQLELDRWLPALAGCARLVDGAADTVRLALRVDAAGRVVTAAAGPSALERCTVAVARTRRLAAGDERLYAVELRYVEPGLPRLIASVEGALAAVPAGLTEQVTALARSTRDCLPRAEGRLASLLTWRMRAGERAVELTGWIPDPAAAGGQEAMGCVRSRFDVHRTIALDAPGAADAIGLVRLAVELPADADAAQHRPQPMTMLGYELAVAADVDGAPATRLRVPPGKVPDLRLRVTPVLAAPGQPVAAQLIRGPQFTGKLPDKLALDCPTRRAAGQPAAARPGPPAGRPIETVVEAPLDADHRATLAIADDVEGWCTVSGVSGGGGARALVYVRPRAELRVTVTPGRDRYAPGERAQLAIQTTLGGKGGPAAVGLFGVDDSLGQLVPLPGADALGRVQPKVETGAPAFGVLDGQALTLGRIRGANAAAATVLRVSAVPRPAELDAQVSGRAESRFDPIEELTDRFYIVLAELHAQVQRWEATAPAAEKMTPAVMAGLWRAALDACAAHGQRVDDAYGRRMRLSRLPPDLLSLTDPRAVVAVATRLPEDVENWPAWVARERP
ncbi:MAG TPA: MG2 domain-containing protein [Kofleriaceae bacterium]|nr:MG2 domain-containing protein [Kofleriaceae bacterium]